MKIKTWELSLALGFVLTLLCGAVFAADIDAGQKELASKVLRLHVVANSDSAGDQSLKLLVRDAVFTASSAYVREAKNSREAEIAIAAHLEELTGIARAAAQSNGCDYNVAVSVGAYRFPTKEYDGFALPAGTYRALRVVIGEGGGANWWCVVFPPLCVPAATSTIADEALRTGLTDGEVKLITESDSRYVYRFKCMEWLDQIKRWLK